MLGGSPVGGPAPIVLRLGGPATRLTDSGFGSFSPDGATVVYASPGGGLCYVTPDGSFRETLAFDPAEPMDGPPAWSPDGSVIAFMDFVEDSPVYGHHAYGMSLIEADGTNLEQLEVRFGGIQQGGGGLEWSPDETKLALAAEGRRRGVRPDPRDGCGLETDRANHKGW